MTIKVYMAGPLFTVAERTHNLRLTELLQQRDPRLNCVLPQVRGEMLYPNLDAIFYDCINCIQDAEVMIACADGADADSGTAFELGFAYAAGVAIIVYRTDFRGSEVDGLNAMLRYCCEEFVNAPSFENSQEQLADKLVEAIKKQFPVAI